MKIQLSSVKPETKEICKNVKHFCFLLTSYFFVLENRAIFHKSVIYVNKMGFTGTVFLNELIHKYF